MENTTDRDARARHRHANISPFLASASTLRTGEDQLPGYYCEQQLSQLKTKTRADGEEDDEHTGGKH